MKKLLLSLAAVVGLGFAANAAEVTFDFVNNEYGMTRLSGSTSDYNENPTTITNEEVSIKLTGNTRLWADGLRFYKSSTMEITAPENYTITKVTFGQNYGSFNYGSSALTSADWTGNAATVSFACNITKSNKAVNTLAITLTPMGDPTKEESGLSYETTDFTITTGETFTAPKLVNPNNLAVTYTSSNAEVATVNAEGVVALAGATGTTTITAKSAETDKFNAGEASYTLTVKAPLQAVNSVAETLELADNTTFKVNYDLTVGYVKFSNIFAVDNAGDFIQIYSANEYKVGDVIPAGWEGTYENYKGNTPEIKNAKLPEAQEGTFTPKTVAAADITNALVNNVVKIENVVLAEASPATKDNFTGKVGETELSFRNNYTLPSVEAGTYNITVVVTIYSNAPSLYVTNFEEAKTPTGIDEIGVDANAPVEYYNLQGVRVANPENGIFIRRQGAKATKVFVK